MNSFFNHPSMIIAFTVAVVIMLFIDLKLVNQRTQIVSNKSASIWSLVWIAISMLFSVFIYFTTRDSFGIEKFAQFQSAYWIEKALSVDNLFVFILVLNFFNVPREYHHRVLFWGVLGALVMRALFIFSGVGIINLTYLPELNLFGAPVKINIVLTLFGTFLVFAGIKSWFIKEDDDNEKDFSKSPGAKIVYRFFRVSKEFDNDKFFTIENGVRMATPLLVVVAVIEFTDLLFAVDSIPAIFAIAPDDPFILYTSNIFAILGLRSLFFFLANFIHMFSRLKYGLAVILGFIGLKMVISPIYHISSTLSLSIVAGLLIISVVASLLFPDSNQKKRIVK
jgi:tellurite resistance protein TerC